MMLRKLMPMKFGPFAVPQELIVEEDVTVLTGANDSGKSYLLKLIDFMCRNHAESVAVEDDRNYELSGETESSWESDVAFGCRAKFKPGQYARVYTGIKSHPGTMLDIQCCFAPGARRTQVETIHVGKLARQDIHRGVKGMPLVLKFPLKHRIGSTIDLLGANPAQKAFLQAAFGPKFSGDILESKNVVNRERDISMAEDKLNDRVQRIIPPGMKLKLRFRMLSEGKSILGVYLRDSHDSYTPLSARGAGVQNLIDIVGTLASTEWESTHVFLLLDEPENSLHADAQHSLRHLLEELAKRDNVQVIYATHSPSMINNMRPQSLRLLTREKKDGKPTSVINNNPIGENFLPVRASLGLSPADSLLYAPLTVVVDGTTEVLCIPIILQRLEAARVDGFEDVSDVLSQTHFLSGEGASFEYHCRLAKSQGAQVILFLDGDDGHKPRVAKVTKEHPDVPVVLLNENKEIEDLVARKDYFRALAEVSGGSSEKLNPARFQKWAANKKFKPKVVFTKRVKNWLDDEFPVVPYRKVEVLKKAVEFAQPASIKSDKLKQLLVEMRVKLQTNS